jgi:hypothetical protein
MRATEARGQLATSGNPALGVSESDRSATTVAVALVPPWSTGLPSMSPRERLERAVRRYSGKSPRTVTIRDDDGGQVDVHFPVIVTPPEKPKPAPAVLEAIDRKILAVLEAADRPLKFREVARRAGFSPKGNHCREAFRKLKNAGVIVQPNKREPFYALAKKGL